LAIDHPVSAERRRAVEDRERKFVRTLRMLGCYALRRVSPPMGASILLRNSPSPPMGVPSLSPRGRCTAPVASTWPDGSGFRYLPAKGLTLSLMVNAHNVAEAALCDD
jgi:hypothetical protein